VTVAILSLCAAPLYAVLTLAAGPPPTVAETIDGRTIEGSWVGLDPAGSLVLKQNDQPITLPITDLLILSWPAASSSPADDSTSQPATTSTPSPWPLTILLKDGCRFPARILTGNARQLVLETSLIANWNLPINLLAAVRMNAGQTPDTESAFNQALADRPAAEDTLLIAVDGRVQTLRGTLESLGPEAGSFRWRQRSIPIPPDRAVGVVFAAGPSGPPTTPPAVCRLHDGSTWTGQLVAGDRDTIRLKLTTGDLVTLPIHSLREIRFNSDRVLFLSDLQPTGYRFDPQSVTPWPWRADRSTANRPLRIAGRSFTRGVGMHAPATLTYELNGTYTRLAAVIGIDDGPRPRGHVVFRVIADDRECFNSGPVTGHDPPRTILVDIGPARRLQLIVDLGDDLDIGDHADWCNLRLIR
jgi:hypothetical protein